MTGDDDKPSTLPLPDPSGGGRVILKTANELQIDGEVRPALIAPTLAMIVA